MSSITRGRVEYYIFFNDIFLRFRCEQIGNTLPNRTVGKKRNYFLLLLKAEAENVCGRGGAGQHNVSQYVNDRKLYYRPGGKKKSHKIIIIIIIPHVKSTR